MSSVEKGALKLIGLVNAPFDAMVIYLYEV